jgi:small neutral amino acid transporter SnatA (MarC family)
LGRAQVRVLRLVFALVIAALAIEMIYSGFSGRI